MSLFHLCRIFVLNKLLRWRRRGLLRQLGGEPHALEQVVSIFKLDAQSSTVHTLGRQAPKRPASRAPQAVQTIASY